MEFLCVVLQGIFSIQDNLKRRKHFRNSRKLKLAHITGMEQAQIENIASFSLSSTGALGMSCMNYWLPSVWYSISSQTFAIMSLATDVIILLVLHHS
jgi:hypothetical protein